MTVKALGYLAIGSTRPDDWAGFATDRLGLQAVDRGGKMRAFRMDDRRQRLMVDGALPDGSTVFGWEVADAAALDTLGAKLDDARVAVKRGSAAAAARRCVAGLISFADPAGNPLEAFHGGAVATDPFKPGRDIGGFRCGALGMGHVLLAAPRIDTVWAFYRDLLGFRISDYTAAPVKAYFTHVNPRHHSLALVEAPHRVMHHLLLELYSLDDVGRGYDMALADGRVAVTLGRHGNDRMTSFYQRTPSPFYVEYGWGGLDVDDATWKPQELKSVRSFWGHRGLFESLGDGPPPPEMPVMPPWPEARAPLNVIEGNYSRLAGVCPWWDTLAARR